MAIPKFLTVNKVRFSWTSCRAQADGLAMSGLTKVDYGEMLEQEDVYDDSNDGVAVGYTAGTYKVDGFTLTMLRQDADNFTTYLAAKGGRPFKGVEWVFSLQCNEPLSPGAFPITMLADTCRIVGEKDSQEQGSGKLVTEFTLKALTIIKNGKTLFDQARNL